MGPARSGLRLDDLSTEPKSDLLRKKRKIKNMHSKGSEWRVVTMLTKVIKREKKKD